MVDNKLYNNYFNEVSDTRRPYVMFRGKSLTREELIQLMLNEEPLFKKWDKDGNDLCINKWDDNRDYYGLLKCCLQRKSFGWETSMVLQDGTIYGSFLESKYPEYDEYVPMWIDFAERNPFVNMVIAYTNIDESNCYWCNKLNDCDKFSSSCKYATQDVKDVGCISSIYPEIANIYKTLKKDFRRNFDNDVYLSGKKINKFGIYCLSNAQFIFKPFKHYSSIKVVLYIHNGRCDILVGEEAQNKFIEYDLKYGDLRLNVLDDCMLFGKCKYNDNYERVVHFPNEFLKECFSRILDVDIYDKVRDKYLLRYEDNKSIVVTKQYLFEQWYEAFNGTCLDISNLNELRNKYIQTK